MWRKMESHHVCFGIDNICAVHQGMWNRNMREFVARAMASVVKENCMGYPLFIRESFKLPFRPSMSMVQLQINVRQYSAVEILCENLNGWCKSFVSSLDPGQYCFNRSLIHRLPMRYSKSWTFSCIVQALTKETCLCIFSQTIVKSAGIGCRSGQVSAYSSCPQYTVKWKVISKGIRISNRTTAGWIRFFLYMHEYILQ